MALLLIAGDLIAFDREWRGWTIRKDKLISPEGWEITVNDVLGVPLMRQQFAAYKAEIRRLTQALHMTQEQPLPEAWPDWIFEMRA